LLLNGKRLLHLGAGEFQLPSIRAAKELGCFVVVTDNVPGNPGHALGDVSESASTVDVDACLALARKHGVDGVMTYGSDVSTPAVAYVAEQLGLPGNPFASASVLQRKDLVRAFQRDHGMNHPAFVVLGSGEQATQSNADATASFPFPGVIKPVDSSGSKGITVVRSAAQVPDALALARTFSRKGLVVLEQYLEHDMLELDGDIWIKDGKLAFRHYGHNFFSKKHRSMAPIGEIFPGFFPESIGEELDAQFAKLIAGLGLRNGCMNFDGAVSGGKVYLFDVALRNGGNFVPYLIQLSSGFNITQAAVCTALGVEYPCESAAAKDPRPVASYVLNSALEGEFRGVVLSPEIQPYFFEERLFVRPGQRVLPFTRGDRALGVLIFKFPDMELMREKMDRIEDFVDVQISATAT
jgi:biotin carboxylase